MQTKRRARPKPAASARCQMEKARLSLRFSETIPATLQALEGVVQNIMALASEMKCGEDHFAEIELALREALANAVIHGNRQDPTKKVEVRCFCQPDRGMLLVVEDEGAGFDPKEIPDPTHAERLFESHGRGLFLIRRTMDSVRFSRSGRRVTMVKRLRR
ncbi:MAG: ATP-binding protein [Terriglobia bacterium]